MTAAVATRRNKKRQPGESIKGSAARFKQIREELKLSQEAFGKALGVTRNSVARWERGEPIPPKLAVLAAEYLLLTFDNQRQQPNKRKGEPQ